MITKTQKIADELHRTLKKIAAEEGRTLQEVTEELLRYGIEQRGNAPTKRACEPSRDGSSKGDN